MDKIINWFSDFGSRYVENTLSIVDLDKMKTDKDYATKMFFFYWAFNRRGAPNGFRIATIKAFNTKPPKDISTSFKEHFYGPNNLYNNPALDPEIIKLDICQTIQLLSDKDIKGAFDSIKLNGIGPKIKSFFLRDIAYLMDMKDLKKEEYVFLNPIDIWVREAIKALKLNFSSDNFRYIDLGGEDLIVSLGLIETSLKAKSSPILVNMGIWYFCSRYIADVGYLKYLLSTPSIEKLNKEVELLGNFGDYKTVLL